MKKITLYLMALCLSLTFQPLQSYAATADPASSVLVANASEKAHAEASLLRLKEINAMDKSNLSSSEKKSLRKEVRAIKHELRSSNGGIYLSVGAVIIIILLLIILL